MTRGIDTDQIITDLARVVVALFPRCRVCGSPVVDAESHDDLRGLKCCVGHDCPCNGRSGDVRTELWPTKEGVAAALSVRRLAAFLRGDLG